MIDLDKALELANASADPYRSDSYKLTATGTTSDPFVRLSTVRYIGLAEREIATNISRATDDEHTFTQQCARGWKWCEEQHNSLRKEYGL